MNRRLQAEVATLLQQQQAAQQSLLATLMAANSAKELLAGEDLPNRSQQLRLRAFLEQ